MKTYLRYLLISILILSVNKAYSFEPLKIEDFNMGVSLSTTGYALDTEVKLNNQFHTRVLFNHISKKETSEKQGVDYDIKAQLNYLAGILDWHFLENGFHLSAGVLYNSNKISLQGEASGGTYNINGTSYTAAEVGDLKVNVDYKPMSSYLGLGWRTVFGHHDDFIFHVNAGGIFQGSADVDVDVNGTLASNTTFQSNLDDEINELKEDLEDYEILPVLSIGLRYKF